MGAQVEVVKEAETCWCPESHVSYRRLPAARLHNCRYIRARNALIDVAQRLADVVAPSGGSVWTAAYLAAMDKLCEVARANGEL